MHDTARPGQAGGDAGHGGLPAYVLISPARNEAAFIEMTLQSMISQSHLPLKWVIVSDGSTDGTDDIVKKYAAEHEWIELLRMPERTERHFAGKVFAFRTGYEKVKDLTFEIVGNLDADISFGPDHFEFILGKFAENPHLGVAGTAFIEDSSVAYNYEFTNIEHVSGQCQLFRRECYEAIGGYTPRKMGGIDLVAVLTARMKGWQTRTFPEKIFVHHRKMGTGMHGKMTLLFKSGQVDYILGSHPIWETVRSIYQMTNKRPFIIRGAIQIAGFYWAMLKRLKRDVPRDFVEFRRKEQMLRLSAYFKNKFLLGIL